MYESTDRAQLPELSLSLIGDYYLNVRPQVAAAPAAHPTPAETLWLRDKYQIRQSDPSASEPTTGEPALAPPVRGESCTAAESHWKGAEELGTIAGFEDHVARFPNCAFVGLARGRIEQLWAGEAAKSAAAKRVAAVQPAGTFKALGLACNHRGAWAVRAGDDIESANSAALSACNSLYGSCFLASGVNSSSFACLSVARSLRHGKNLTSATRTTLDEATSGALDLCASSNRGPLQDRICRLQRPKLASLSRATGPGATSR